MKKIFLGTLIFTLVQVTPPLAMAGVDIGISISLPPPIVFSAPPEVIVLPETYVYAVPDIDADMYFYNGWWWRLWDGRWYRSRFYASGWSYYQRVPSFYTGIPSGWRNDYREHRWEGHQWNYRRIPQQQVQRNWRSWEKNKHWEKQQTWGVQGLKPRARSQQPSQAVQPKPREAVKPHQQGQQPRDVKPQQPRSQSQSAKPKSREAAKPQQQRPQPREVQPQRARPQSQSVKPQQQPQRQRPQPREGQPQHVQPQHQEAPRQSKPQQGRPERGAEDKQERR